MTAKYKIAIQETSGAAAFCCEGSIYKPDPTGGVIKAAGGADGAGGPIGPVDLRETVAIEYEVTNGGVDPLELPVLVVSEYGALALGLEGTAPSESGVETILTIPAGATVPLNLVARRRDDGSSLPDFVRVSVYLGANIPLAGQVPADHVRMVQLVQASPPTPRALRPMRTSFVEIKHGPSRDSLKITVEVLSGPLSLTLWESGNLVDWTLAPFRLASEGPSTLHSTELASGTHSLFVDKPDLLRNFYRLLCE